ncbi:MAG TPA: sulfatase [Thermoanaerobaculia bacterium]|nr:sulfatase [Thermoanaerobaculia bacterium]
MSRRPAPRRLPRLAALALAVPLAACQAPEPSSHWERFDLTREPFRVEMRSGAQADVRILQAPRGLSRPVAGRPWGPPEVDTLRQAVGSRLSWRLVLGDEPYLHLVPLGSQRPGCSGELLAALRDRQGVTTELVREPARLPGLFAPADRELDLGPWAGEPVDILLAVLPADPPAPQRRWRPCRGIWGSPAVYSRRRPATERTPRVEQPNLVLIGLDTFRADHWTSPPPGRVSRTPALDRLATESDVWVDAYSTFNNTNPSFISIHTGLYGRSHGIYDLVTPLPEEHTTLAEHFRAAGYSTAAVLAARHLLPPSSGLGQGFDEIHGPVRSTAAASLVVDRGLDWIAEREDDPFFLWLHLFDVHVPTLPPEPFASGFRAAAPSGLSPVTRWTPFREPGPRRFADPEAGAHPDLYAGAAAYLDRQIDRLLGDLETRGLLADTFVVVVADHGESLGEHGLLHKHFGLYEPSVHVPLVVRWPDAMAAPGLARGARRGRRIAGLVQTVDLFPSLLAATGLTSLERAVTGVEGRDLWQLGLARGGEGGGGRAFVVAEHANRQGAMIRTRHHKYIWMEENDFLAPGAYLFDLVADPEELVNRAGRGLAVERRLAEALAVWRAADTAVPATRTPDDEELDSLRALGYLR